MDSSITIRGLNVTFRTRMGEVRAVEDVNTVFEAGKITGLIGESGSGKSVLGMSLLRLLPSNAVIQGECLYRGQDLVKCTSEQIRELRGNEIGLIPQNPTESLNPVIRLRRQLTEAVTTHDKKNRSAALARGRELLERFGFADPDRILNSYSFQLSGGMNQRVVSALGLMNRPGWIIADEPTKGLDAILRKQVYHVLKSIAEQDTSSMILITHDITLAEKLCQRLMVLYEGQVLEQGDTQTVLNDPRHPYTKGLINAQPSRGMIPVDGVIGERRGCRKGCRFYPRCPLASDQCGQSAPGDFPAENGSTVRCFLCG